MQPYRLEEADLMGSLMYGNTPSGNAVYTPKQLSTPMGVSNYSRSTHSTPYTLDGSPYLANPGSAPFILPMQSIPQALPYYSQSFQGASHNASSANTSISASTSSGPQGFDRSTTMYLQHPQSPSPTPTPTSALKARQGRYWELPGPSYSHNAQIDRHSHPSQPRRRADSRNDATIGADRTLVGNSRTVQIAPSNPYAMPHFAAAGSTSGHQRMSSASTTSTSGPSSVSLHMRTQSSSHRNDNVVSPGTYDHGHQRSWSCDTDSRQVIVGSNDTPHRSLEIRCSATEGRRLVFPDQNAAIGSSPGINDNDDSSSIRRSSSQAGLPFTPQRQARGKVSRSEPVPILSLTTGADGTAVIGVTSTSRANLDWMPHQVHSPTRGMTTEKESDTCLMIGQLTLRTPKRSKGCAPIRETDSVKRRKRLEAFSEAGQSTPGRSTGFSPSPTKPNRKSPRPGRQLSMSRITGFGRLAVKEEVATRFLHLDPTRVTDLSDTNMPADDISSSQNEATAVPQGDLGVAVRASVEAKVHAPDWPDVHAPWAQETQWERDNAVDRASRLDQLRFASIERYLEGASDTEQDESDSKLVLTRLLRKRGITSKDSANACEAVLHARRHGNTLSDRDLEIGLTLPIIGPNEETGCLCGGSNDKGGAMVCCDSCSVWYHLACCGIQTEDDLDDQWFCQRCQTQMTPQKVAASATLQEAPSGFPSTPETQRALGPAFAAATNETTRSYHAHTSDAALAPSPTFSPNGRFPVSLMDTPALYTSPRVTSGSSVISRNLTPGTPLVQPRLRVVSYAEHYNVCQTPGASDSDYKKIYSTPKFEDFFESGLQPSSTTPALRNRSSPMDSTSSASGSGPAGFATPSSSQNFLRSLQPASSAPASDAMGLSSALLPSSPLVSGARMKHPAGITDSISPSPYREHRRQISFGARVASFGPYTSHLRDHMIGESPDREPLRLGGELNLAPPENSSLQKDSGG